MNNIKGKLFYKHYKDEGCGNLGGFACNYEGIDYYVGDVVEVLKSDKDRDVTIICNSPICGYLPMGYSNFEYITEKNYKLRKIKNWYDLKDGEDYRDTVIVELEEPKSMNTIELLQFAQLEENQGKKLKCKNIDGIYHIKNKFIYWDNEYISVKHHLENDSHWTVIEEHWKEVEVLLALKSRQEGKEVKCLLNDKNIDYWAGIGNIENNQYPKLDDFIEYINFDAILNGKWFVRE